jgi:hypothetical protein
MNNALSMSHHVCYALRLIETMQSFADIFTVPKVVQQIGRLRI